MAIHGLEEDNRQRVAAAKLNEAELMDNCSSFRHTQVNWTYLKIGNHLKAWIVLRIG